MSRYFMKTLRRSEDDRDDADQGFDEDDNDHGHAIRIVKEEEGYWSIGGVKVRVPILGQVS